MLLGIRNLHICKSRYTTNYFQAYVFQRRRSSPSDIDVACVMNVHKQTGGNDCALFAMATITHLALGKDPTTVVFQQRELRSHHLKSLESRTVGLFPVSQTRKRKEAEIKVDSFKIYCTCRLPDDGRDSMICCDVCSEWFHERCIDTEIREKQDKFWACCACSSQLRNYA